MTQYVETYMISADYSPLYSDSKLFDPCLKLLSSITKIDNLRVSHDLSLLTISYNASTSRYYLQILFSPSSQRPIIHLHPGFQKLYLILNVGYLTFRFWLDKFILIPPNY